MTAGLVVFIVACTGLWDGIFPVIVDAQSCVDGPVSMERVFYVGQVAPYQLDCPLDEPAPSLRVTWLKDCRPLPGEQGATLTFPSPSPVDQGNYTCTAEGNGTASFTVRLTVKEPPCSRAPAYEPRGGPTELWETLGSTATLNCTVLLAWDPEGPCDTTPRWDKDGSPLLNRTLYPRHTSSWSPRVGLWAVSSVLEVKLGEQADFGLYSCAVRDASARFSLQDINKPSHTAAVIAAIILLLVLAIAALVFSKCHLNFKLWYRNSYGDYELNDGKMYDAYISYVNNEYDRKFVNFILKPHLENKHGYKLHLNNNDILPGSEPSAELLVNGSRCRRLVVVLSHAYLEQDWCNGGFRQGLMQLLEVSPHPVLITLEGQMKRMRSEVVQTLREQQHRLTVLCWRHNSVGLLQLLEVSSHPVLITLEGQMKRMRSEVVQTLREQQHRLTILCWRHNSVAPSSAFWKELALAMPRKLLFRTSESAGDPQTLLQEDKDPMLSLDPDYLDCRADTDPDGDLGLRLPVYKAMTSRAPVLPAAPMPAAQARPSDIDVSDLGSRSYAVRTDFYCLVTEEDI